MRKLFWIALILCTAMVVGCGKQPDLIETQLEIKRVDTAPNGAYTVFIADPQTREARRLFFGPDCHVTIKEDVEKGAPVYADAKYYINQNGPPNAKRVYKEVVIHLHSAEEINSNIQK